MRSSLQFTDLAYIAYTEGEISGIMWRDVFCAHKLYGNCIMCGVIHTCSYCRWIMLQLQTAV